MRFFLTTLIILFSVALLSAQSGRYWTDIEPSQIFLPEDAVIEQLPSTYRLLSLDLEQLKSELANAPMEFTNAVGNRPVVVTLPMPDGSFEEFEMVESPCMMPELAAKFPEIRSFAGKGKNLKGAYTRFDYSPKGLFGSIEYEKNSIYLMPIATLQTEYYACFKKQDLLIEGIITPHVCSHTGDTVEDNILDQEYYDPIEEEDMVFNRNLGEKVELRTYRLAIATTGEFSVAQGGTIPSVMSAINTAVNRVNINFGKDCDVRFMLVNNNDLLISLDPATDPYDINSLAGVAVDASVALINNTIGIGNYDTGQLFQQGVCDNGGQFLIGGFSSLSSVCQSNKANAITCFTSSVMNTADGTMSHELGHAFSATHSWNACPGAETAYTGATAYEPGSGSTILSYSGGCGGGQNVNDFGINYFHTASIIQITNYSTTGGGNNCPAVIETDNNKPEMSLPYTNGFSIPISTPFELTGEASDEDGETLTYCWEQYDVGPYALMGSPIGDCPLFRSFPPSVDGATRTFPNIQAIVNNQIPINEYLPDYSRNLTFHLTVRDNNSNGGGVAWKQVKFKSTATAGPFLVNYPNDAGLTVEAGNQETVTWDVANTNNSIVNCQTVNILMSEDGGFTYPYLLACSTPNDGTEIVSIPNIATANARIKIEAADNIFFDISNNDFSITAPSVPGFSLTACDQFQQVCVPDVATVNISTASFLGYDSLLTLEIVEGLPAGLTPIFSTNPVMAGENTSISFDMSSLDADGLYEVLLRATGPSADTFYQTLIFNIVYNDFSELAMLTPNNGATGQTLASSFTWVDLPHADRYDFEIATAPTFSEDVMIESAYNLINANYTLTVGLEENTIYFWRIRPSNECGKSEFLVPFVFSTFTVTCNEYENENGTTPIGAGINATATATIAISENGTISDVNVRNVKGEYDAVPDLEIKLKSPTGTEVLLFGDICGNTSLYNIALDDEAAFPAGTDCPPTNGIAYQPFGSLSDFDGENTQGTWELKVKVLTNLGSGGYLADWGLEFCASFEPNAPFLVNNNLLPVQPLGSRRISTPDLLVEDLDNLSYELFYKLLSVPAHGYLTLDGVTLNVGDAYNQADLDWADVRYHHTDPSQVVGDMDEFYFIVEDGTGGWLGTPKFTLILDENVATTDIDWAATVNLYPNPAQDRLNVSFNQPLTGNTTISISDVQGRLLQAQKLQNVQNTLEFSTSNLSDGIYFMTIQTEDSIFTKKFAVQR